MTAPRPPSLEEIEEDLAAAPHTDPAFSSALTYDKTGQESQDSLRDGIYVFFYIIVCTEKAGVEGDEAAAVAEQAVKFVLSYQQLQENYAHSLPRTLHAVEQHIADLRTAIRTCADTSK